MSYQWFLKTPLTPEGGLVTPPDSPGLGMDVDPAKIEEQRTLSWEPRPWT